MGGTSTDVALVAEYALPLKRETVLGGEVIRLPQLDIHTVGAGGGSVASLDGGGGLQLGPQSAGASPGPAAYGHGGERPTVTDANVVLGRLGGAQELGRSLTLDGAAAARVVGRLAAAAGLSLVAMADGIVDLAVAKMAAAVYEISVARGYDPAECVLLCYGGAGPLHACLVAEELGIQRVIAPPDPGAFSSLGALCAALTRDRTRTWLAELNDLSLNAAEEFFTASALAMQQEFAAEGVDAAGLVLERQLDLRYSGQAHELTVVMAEAAGLASVVSEFEAAFEREYGRLDRGRALVLVNARAVGRVRVVPPRWRASLPGSGIPVSQRAVQVRGATRLCEVWRRADLSAAIAGPAIIEEMSATTYLPPGWSARVGLCGELAMTRLVST